ncbi:hypothetical protein ACFXPY_32255 [Streptomyces sp. NPDC059153]|uniref:hypothetical protein n=1 Tax=Streptomyces sp. NPDC059153 TaxID=3346743 RepID=UPI0036BA92A6
MLLVETARRTGFVGARCSAWRGPRRRAAYASKAAASDGWQTVATTSRVPDSGAKTGPRSSRTSSLPITMALAASRCSRQTVPV